MHKLITYIKLFSLSTAFLASSSFILLDEANPENLYVVRNSSVKSSLTESEFHDILFTKKSQWSDGKPIVVACMFDRHPSYQILAKDLYKLTPTLVNKIWLKASMNGKGTLLTFNLESDLLAYVENTPGAIGFILKEDKYANVKRININD